VFAHLRYVTTPLRLWWATISAYVLLALPLVLLAIWYGRACSLCACVRGAVQESLLHPSPAVFHRRGIVVANKVDPPLIGVVSAAVRCLRVASLPRPHTPSCSLLQSFITAWPALLVLVYTLLAWRSSGWLVARTHALKSTPTHFTTVRVGACIATLLLAGFEFAVLYNGNYVVAACKTNCGYEYSFVGSSWIWLGNNMVLVTLVVAGIIRPPGSVSVSRFVRQALLGHDVEGGAGPGVGAGAGAGAGAAGAGAAAVVREDSRAALVSSMAAADGESTTYFFGSRARHLAVLYVSSVCLLVAYAIINVVLADNAVDSGKYLGFTTAGAVLIMDLCMYLLYRADILTTLGPTLVFVTAR
jgi:hypothetical protein